MKYSLEFMVALILCHVIVCSPRQTRELLFVTIPSVDHVWPLHHWAVVFLSIGIRKFYTRGSTKVQLQTGKWDIKHCFVTSYKLYRPIDSISPSYTRISFDQSQEGTRGVHFFFRTSQVISPKQTSLAYSMFKKEIKNDRLQIFVNCSYWSPFILTNELCFCFLLL